MMLLAFNKPYGVLSQFSPSAGKITLAEHIDLPKVYPTGRLDFDSEGLLLTDDGVLQHAIAHPGEKLSKRYWVQIEGLANETALNQLRSGVMLGDFQTRAANAKRIDEPAGLWPRQPPIRRRIHIPTSWLEIEISEGKNRQVRRMTAAVGYPTLRLIRCAIGRLDLMTLGLLPGQWKTISAGQLGLNQQAHDRADKKILSTDFARRRYRK